MTSTTIDLSTTDNFVVLRTALSKTPKAILERTILEGAQTDSRVAKIFWDALVALDDSDAKVAKFQTCRHCKQGFDITTNDHNSCVWHYGNLTIDEEVWVDHYDPDGPIDTKENREDAPHGFFWDCCGLQLDSEGCLRTKHAPLAVLKRNDRVLEPVESARETGRYPSEISERNSGPPPAKKRKVGGKKANTRCRACGELYDESVNTERACNWHDFDAVRKITGESKDGNCDGDEDQYYSDDEDEADEDDSEARMIQWTCCGSKEKEGGCVVTQHLPPRRLRPIVEATI
ncbi:hypothetical protein MVEN_00215500 [Mycena venus]|uniref:C2H2-type domain-containing protein n=1 Tax=Mycena venus TaxID=2733690 RepID=A0A8H6Z1Y3_9AGAR|nr:hypothetical protein MVEN_00215500 [Mycena venus]